MRLTLRTLLAYLDNTLEPADVELLRTKVSESGFAGQLVQRIRTSLADPKLSAPAPDAVGPIDEANMISEYLDSTLPGEQVAETERACLESDVHLAEAAACHQILTMVLGKSAEVSPELRERIYQLPDRDIADIATAGSFASVSVPNAEPSDATANDISKIEGVDIPVAGGIDDEDISPATQGTAVPPEPVTPVGPGDSGVSDAPTRIRQSDAAIAGSSSGERPGSALEAAQLYGGSIRTSRIAPWLVSLALVAILLFALVRIFQPLLDQGRISDADMLQTPEFLSTEDSDAPSPSDNIDFPSTEEKMSIGESETPNDNVSIEEPVGTPDGNLDQVEKTDDMVDGGKSDDSSKPDNASDARSEVNSETMQTVESATVEDPIDTDDKATSDTERSELATENDTVAVADPMNADDERTEPPAPPAKEDMATLAESKPPETMKEDSPETTSSDPDGPVSTVANLSPDITLLFAINEDGEITRVAPESSITTGQTLIAAPTFRVRVDSVANVTSTLIGPTKVTFRSKFSDSSIPTTEEPVLDVAHGRLLLEATKPGSQLNIEVAGQMMNFKFPSIETLAAVTTTRFRPPGLDPLQDENHISTVGVLCTQGSLELSVDGETITLASGQRWVRRNQEDPVTSKTDTFPIWIQPDDPDNDSLEALAREGMLELISDKERPIEIQLREAMQFRRSEVGALAARTMLAMGRADVYFGVDGTLSQASQWSYWKDHYQALVAAIDRDTQSAQSIKDSIMRMDATHARELYRLLVGFSQRQLVEGADKELVELLDSPTMSVRALALENLRRITGTTLSFRAQQDNPIRRNPGIKKWDARRRNGDIRWQQP